MNTQETFYRIRGWTPPAIQLICWLVFWLPFRGLWWMAFTFARVLTFIFVPAKMYEQAERDLITGRFNPDAEERERWIKYKL